MKNAAPDDLTAADGMTLAIQMLAELEEHPDQTDLCCIEDGARPDGVAQRNVLFEYLNGIVRAGSPEVMLGFTSVLSDFIASCAGNVHASTYEKFVMPPRHGAH